MTWTATGSGGYPADDADFVGGLRSGTLTFAAGESNRTITLEVMGDAVIGSDEEFTVSLWNPSSSLVIGAAAASGTIVNDDASVSIAAQAAALPEGDSGTAPFTFTVTRTRGLVSEHGVSWSIVGSRVDGADPSDIGGTALNGGTVTIAAGETTQVIVVEVAGDAEIELDEAFAVTLSAPSAGLVLGTASAVGSVQNDDRSTISIAALSAVKAGGDSGTATFTFMVNLSQAGVTGQTVAWAVTGSGSNPASTTDFTGDVLPTGTVTFLAGETSKTIAVGVAGDVFVEAAEGFAVTLSSPTPGLVLGAATATGTIENDDTAAVVTARSPTSPARSASATRRGRSIPSLAARAARVTARSAPSSRASTRICSTADRIPPG